MEQKSTNPGLSFQKKKTTKKKKTHKENHNVLSNILQTSAFNYNQISGKERYPDLLDMVGHDVCFTFGIIIMSWITFNNKQMLLGFRFYFSVLCPLLVSSIGCYSEVCADIWVWASLSHTIFVS